MATIRYRQNNISKFTLSDGREVSDHNEKAALLYTAYKERLGQSRPIHFLPELQSLIQQVDGLNSLSAAFTREEIDEVIKELPTDKAPGPDGFNGMFIKRCWHIIKHDFYELCKDFLDGKVDLQSINDSFITLIPKIHAPETPNDFRPISLLNSCLKILTKLFANRLQSKILKLVHKNQYGFIKSRTIQDCLAWSFEYLFQCNQSGKQIIVFKIDFTKAFDMMEHAAILKIFKLKGCDEIWLNCLEHIMNSGTSSVLLNGVPGKKFHCKRGVRQGDPLSPLLYVGTADLLQSMINNQFRIGNFSAPIPIPNHDFPVIQYADDTIVIMEACPVQVTLLKNLINEFAEATGLRVNFQKSNMIPINCSEEVAANLASILECQIASMPFTYLGLPLGTTKPTVQDLSPLLDDVERRLNACSRFLSYAGRLIYVDSVLSALPTFYMCTMKIQKSAIKIIDRGRRHCLWAKKDDWEKHAQSLVAWEKVCMPKDKGGLGILNLEIQNDTLLLKYMHKFMNKADVPWVDLIWHTHYNGKVPHAAPKAGSFWWKDICSLFDQYRGIASCSIGSGNSVLLWKDKWLNEELLANSYDRLFSFALNQDISVFEGLQTGNLASLFYLPLSVQAFDELQLLQGSLNVLRENADGDNDQWKYSLNNGTYTSSSYYKFLFQGLPAETVFKWL
jgi:hypothetical protein